MAAGPDASMVNWRLDGERQVPGVHPRCPVPAAAFIVGIFRKKSTHLFLECAYGTPRTEKPPRGVPIAPEQTVNRDASPHLRLRVTRNWNASSSQHPRLALAHLRRPSAPIRGQVYANVHIVVPLGGHVLHKCHTLGSRRGVGRGQRLERQTDHAREHAPGAYLGGRGRVAPGGGLALWRGQREGRIERPKVIAVWSRLVWDDVVAGADKLDRVGSGTSRP